MKITSTSFLNNEVMPDKYGCNADNISPQLSWSDFPPETKSFAITCIDPDSPSGNFIHWMMLNIPSAITQINEGTMQIDNVTNIKNDFGKTLYGGPCPATGEHHYVFTIYALSTEMINNIDKDNFMASIKPYIIDQANITGLYKKK